MSRPTEIVLPANRGTGIVSKPDAPKPQAPRPEASPAVERPETPPVPAVESEPESEPKPKRTRKPRQPAPSKSSDTPHDFLIAYQGEFIGCYRSPRKVTGQTALRIIAEQLDEAFGDDFDLDALEIFRPVPIQCPRPDRLDRKKSGTFRWFGE